MITRFAAGVLAVGLLSGAAQASTITLGLPDLANFSQLGSSAAGTITVNNGLIPAGTDITFTTIFVPPQTGAQTADVGLAGLNIPFNAGDDFMLNLENTNENPWDFQLVVVTDQGVFSSALQSLVPTQDADFTASLGGVAGTISSAYFVIGGTVPYPDGDRTPEYQINPIPEPASLALLTLGATCLATRRR